MISYILQYDGSYLAMFLTDGQRHYYNTLKKLGNKKPQKTIRRPKVCYIVSLSQSQVSGTLITTLFVSEIKIVSYI